jgi:hypothetical protein
VIGSAFVTTGALKLRIAHRNTNLAVYATAIFIALLTVILIPWVLSTTASELGSFYYRLIGAITILAATSLSLSVIFNRIAISQHPELHKSNQPKIELPSGMLAIYIVIGTIVGLAWFVGLFALIGSAAAVDRSTVPYTPYYSTPYN